MRKKIARDFCSECINQVLGSGTSPYIENPAIVFDKKAKRGDFDTLSDKEHNTLLGEIEQLAKLFDDHPRRAAGSILLDILANAPKANDKLKDDLANLFARLLVGPDDSEIPPLSAKTLKAADDYVCEQTEEMLDDLEHRFDDIDEELIWEPFKKLPPKKIRDNITKKVVGQPEAVKAAAMIIYNLLSGRRTNAVFAGPSGCGKSEIWRTLTKEYPDLVRMVDFSRFTAEGWNGSLHLRDIFDGIDAAAIKDFGMVVVLDESDKILCEAAVGRGGTDHHALLQNDLLKMMDGDVIEFGEDSRKAALSIDCAKVSVVMLGAFERLLEGKTQDAKRIGFGPGAASKADAGDHKDISYEDLIHAGMRREIAGRINKIVALNPISVEDYKSILKGPVLDGLQESTGCKISIDGAAADALAERAIESGLGVRWVRSEILNAIDDAAFDAPETKAWSVTLRDGRLRCRARRPRGGVHAAKRSRQGCSHPECGVVMEDLPF